MKTAAFVKLRASYITILHKQMKCLDLTLPTPAANLALDEALLDACEEDAGLEVLRFWEPKEYFVVVGYANEVKKEANVGACTKDNVPILRRCTGGGTVLQGAGCLNYTLILQIAGNPALQNITGTNRFIMERQRRALAPLLSAPIRVQGHTDLTMRDLKFSGNAQRRKRNALIFHGTLLLDFNRSQIEKYLAMPSREPDYRQNRRHTDFLMNLNIPIAGVKSALTSGWLAGEVLDQAPDFQKLLTEKYEQTEWNLKF